MDGGSVDAGGSELPAAPVCVSSMLAVSLPPGAELASPEGASEVSGDDDVPVSPGVVVGWVVGEVGCGGKVLEAPSGVVVPDEVPVGPGGVGWVVLVAVTVEDGVVVVEPSPLPQATNSVASPPSKARLVRCGVAPRLVPIARVSAAERWGAGDRGFERA